MENPITLQCKQLLGRIRISNIQSFFPKTRSKSQKDSKLQSLSLQRRKMNQSLKRQYSLTGGFDKIMFHNDQKLQKSNQKTSAQKQNSQICQPQFNLRKGTKITLPIKPLRQPFTNLTNGNKFRLTLHKDKSLHNQISNKSKNPIQKSLHVNGLVKGNHHQNSSPNTKQKHVSFVPSRAQFHDDSENSVETASKVNEIYSFIKDKSHQEGQDIGEFTEIIFKVVCYLFVSFISEKWFKINFDPRKMIDFIEQQIHQSYSALNSFKKSRKQIFSNENIKQNEGNAGQNSGANVKRKRNRVSSFFKSVENGENQSPNQKEDPMVSSLRKFNQAMSTSEDSDPRPYQKNNLRIPQTNGNRRLSIALNLVKEANEQHSEITLSDKTQTQNSNPNTNTNEKSSEEILEQSNKVLPRLNYRNSTTRRKSCFLTEMNRLDFHKQTSQQQVLRVNENVNSNFKLSSQITSKNNSGSDLPSQNQLKSVVSYFGLSNSGIQGMPSNRNFNSKSKIKSKSTIKSKANLKLSTPYDFMKDDNLMAKRRKYLELHQQLTTMADNIDELKKEEQQITQRIELKDSELISMENKLIDINQEIQMFQNRSKEAENFLNGTECPQMVQKIIKKNIELKKNLTSLLNSHAWESSNLTQSSHSQHIYATKQSSMDKLNSLTRRFRGCKNLQNIESLVGEMRDIFQMSIERYSQIIDEFQDKLGQAEEERSNMLKNLQDWEIENKIKEKLLNNSFIDYYSVERRVTIYIEKLPEALKKLQQSVFSLSHQRKADYVVGQIPESSSQLNRRDSNNSSKSLQKTNNEVNSKKILMMENQMVAFLDKMLGENVVIATQLPKQKKFAMVLERIV